MRGGPRLLVEMGYEPPYRPTASPANNPLSTPRPAILY